MEHTATFDKLDSCKESLPVRREEVRVEHQGDVNVQGDDTDMRDSNINNQ